MLVPGFEYVPSVGGAIEQLVIAPFDPSPGSGMGFYAEVTTGPRLCLDVDGGPKCPDGRGWTRMDEYGRGRPRSATACRLARMDLGPCRGGPWSRSASVRRSHPAGRHLGIVGEGGLAPHPGWRNGCRARQPQGVVLVVRSSRRCACAAPCVGAGRLPGRGAWGAALLRHMVSEMRVQCCHGTVSLIDPSWAVEGHSSL